LLICFFDIFLKNPKYLIKGNTIKYIKEELKKMNNKIKIEILILTDKNKKYSSTRIKSEKRKIIINQNSNPFKTLFK
jgi:hypothetical protein